MTTARSPYCCRGKAEVALVKLQTLDGRTVQYDDAHMLGQGGMKDVFMGHDKRYVVAW